MSTSNSADPGRSAVEEKTKITSQTSSDGTDHTDEPPSTVWKAIGNLLKVVATELQSTLGRWASKEITWAAVVGLLVLMGVTYNTVFFSSLGIPVIHLSSWIDFILPGVRQILTSIAVVIVVLLVLSGIASVRVLLLLLFALTTFVLHSGSLVFLLVSSPLWFIGITVLYAFLKVNLYWLLSLLQSVLSCTAWLLGRVGARDDICERVAVYVRTLKESLQYRLRSLQGRALESKEEWETESQRIRELLTTLQEKDTSGLKERAKSLAALVSIYASLIHARLFFHLNVMVFGCRNLWERTWDGPRYLCCLSVLAIATVLSWLRRVLERGAMETAQFRDRYSVLTDELPERRMKEGVGYLRKVRAAMPRWKGYGATGPLIRHLNARALKLKQGPAYRASMVATVVVVAMLVGSCVKGDLDSDRIKSYGDVKGEVEEPQESSNKGVQGGDDSGDGRGDGIWIRVTSTIPPQYVEWVSGKASEFYDYWLVSATPVHVLFDAGDRCPQLYEDLLHIGSTSDFLLFWGREGKRDEKGNEGGWQSESESGGQGNDGGGATKGGTGNSKVLLRGNVIEMFPILGGGEGTVEEARGRVESCREQDGELGDEVQSIRVGLRVISGDLARLDGQVAWTQAALSDGMDTLDEGLTATRERVDGGFARTGAKLSSMTGDLARLDGQVAWTQAALSDGMDTLDEGLTATRERVDGGFARTGTKLSSMTGDLARLDGQVAWTQAALSDGMDTLDEGLTATRERVDGGFARTGTKLSSMTGDLARLDGQVAWTQAALSDGMDTLDEGLTATRERVDGGFARTGTKLSSMTGDLARLDGQVAWTQAALSDGMDTLDEGLTATRESLDGGLSSVAADVAWWSMRAAWSQATISRGVGTLDRRLATMRAEAMNVVREIGVQMREAGEKASTGLDRLEICVHELELENEKTAYRVSSCPKEPPEDSS